MYQNIIMHAAFIEAKIKTIILAGEIMRNIETIYFDLGYTLVDETAAWQKRCAEQCALRKADGNRISPQTLWHNIEIASAKRAKSPYRAAAQELGFDVVIPYDSGDEKIYPETAAVLKKLKERYRLGILANQADGMCERLEKFGIREFFYIIISSFDYKLNKPNVKLFDIAAQKAQCKPDRIAMIGDRLDNDIAPAKSIGWKTVWIKQGFGAFQSPIDSHDTPDFIVHSLSELPSIF